MTSRSKNMAKHYLPSCLVEISPQEDGRNEICGSSDEKGQDVDQAYSTSGILINPIHGYVLTHGSILLTYLTNNKDVLSRLSKNGHVPSHAFRNLHALITLDQLGNTKHQDGKLSVHTVFTSTSGERKKHDQFHGRIELVWKAERFANTVQAFLPKSDDWSFYAEPNPDSQHQNSITEEETSLQIIDPDLVAKLLPYFVLVKLDNWNTQSTKPGNTKIFTDNVKVGDPVHMIGTPFGSMSPSVFFNSLSQGVVSNVAGRHQELIVTDARCIPGTEGGPLYQGQAKENGGLVGIVVSALCWKSNEWIGLSLACRLTEILHSLSEYIDIQDVLDSLKPKLASLPFHRHGSVTPHSLPVVLVTSGSSWGSGLVIDHDTGLVITCGHVVKGKRKVKVRFDFPKLEWFEAEVLHATPTNKTFDIGVLRMKNYTNKGPWPSRFLVADTVEQGEECFVVGHAMFDTRYEMCPSVTSGVISKVIASHNHPVLIQSTCTVNAGASGGPLVTRDGKIFGIVTCNAKDTLSGASYPNINLSVPMKTIWPVIEQFLVTGEKAGLAKLHIQNKDINALWSMQELQKPKNSDGIESKL